MKKISILMALTLTLAASCNKALEKDVVESGFAPAQSVPTVSSLTVTEVNEVEKKAVISATFADVSADLDSLEIGFLSSTDPTFATSSVVLVENPADGTYSAEVTVVPGTTNYFVAMAATTGGANYTEVVSYDVPDIPMYAKLAKSYSGTYYSWYDGSAANKVYLDIADDHTTVTLYNWDPFIAGYAKPASPEANRLVGVLDEENYVITFTADQPPFFMLGFADAAVVVFGEDGETPVTEFVVKVSADCQSITLPEYGCYSTGQGGFYDGWGGDEATATGPIVLRAN